MFYNKSAIMGDDNLFGFYINLDKRIDRKDHFEQNVKCHSFFSNIERISAIYHDSTITTKTINIYYVIHLINI